MNKAEARGILARELLHFRAMSYSDLKKLMGSPQVFERSGASGVSYTIEIEVFWDSPHDPGGDLRVIACVDDGRFLSVLSPLSSGFIMDQEGKFIGE
mgnify:CR=1 FL=1